MFAPNSYNTLELGVSNAKAVVSLEWLYESLKNHMGRLLVLFLVAFLALPLTLFFGFWLSSKRKKFQKQMKRELPLFKNNKDYLLYKTSLHNLSELLPALKKVSNHNPKNAPWVLRFTLSRMQRMTSTLLTYNDWMVSRLDCLNEEQFKSKTSVFKLRSEKDLWANRNSAYQYWM